MLMIFVVDIFVVFFCVIYCCSIGCCLALVADLSIVPVPPMIVSEAQDEIAYRVRELVEIPCVASGDPPPS